MISRASRNPVYSKIDQKEQCALVRAGVLLRLNMEYLFLQHQIGISEILPWDRKSYLTHAILLRLSCEGNIHWLYGNSRTLSSSDVIVMFKWCHHVKLYLSLFRDFWKLIFLNEKKKQWWARKRIHYLCEGRIEKSVPRDHCLSSLGKPCDAKPQSSGQIFLSYPHDRFLYSWSGSH